MVPTLAPASGFTCMAHRCNDASASTFDRLSALRTPRLEHPAAEKLPGEQPVEPPVAARAAKQKQAKRGPCEGDWVEYNRREQRHSEQLFVNQGGDRDGGHCDDDAPHPYGPVCFATDAEVIPRLSISRERLHMQKLWLRYVGGNDGFPPLVRSSAQRRMSTLSMAAIFRVRPSCGLFAQKLT